MILAFLASWAPFKIDALGLITILGTTELDMTVGSLVRNRLTDFLPLLAAFLIAGNNILSPIPGFAVYNITDGILATDVSGWLARWLLCQDFTWNSTELRLQLLLDIGRRNRFQRRLSEVALGVLGISTLLVFPILTADWFGLANSLSMTASVFVRWAVVSQNRNAIDRDTLAGLESSSEVIKTFWTLPTGKAVAMYVPRGVLIGCFLTTPQPPSPLFYSAARMAGWVAFGCHIITLGMTSLFNQLVTVFVLIAATFLTSRRIGADNSHIASHLAINRFDHPDPHDSRTSAYVRLNLSYTEERKLLAWNLVPHESNQEWWQKYRTLLGKERESYRSHRAHTI